MKYILITGGTGFIGSHVCVELLLQGKKVIVIDNFSNSNASTLFKMRQLSGCSDDDLLFFKIDIRDEPALSNVVETHDIDACIHLAGSKAVGESVADPLKYYDNNIKSTITLLQILDRASIHRVVFSSSATVYGEPKTLPIKENDLLCPTNPYGRTKFYLESMFQDLAQSHTKWQIIMLRYFNPVGAHPTGLIGEDPHGTPNNLMPYITHVAGGKRSQLTIFGGDYDTPDGTCLRDYVHVCDLATGHVAAINHLFTEESLGCVAVNLGTGHATSVFEIVHAMKAASGKSIPYVIGERRDGDATATYCDTTLAETLLGWKATRKLKDMCEDSWRFQNGI